MKILKDYIQNEIKSSGKQLYEMRLNEMAMVQERAIVRMLNDLAEEINRLKNGSYGVSKKSRGTESS